MSEHGGRSNEADYVGPLAADDPRHGTENGYTNLGCRCNDCRAAWTKVCLRRREERRARLATADVAHGSESTYFNHACRCDACKSAHTEGERQRRARRLARADLRTPSGATR